MIKSSLIPKILLLGLLLTLLPSVMHGQDEAVEWTDITDKIFTNPIDAGGWQRDENGKVYKDNEGQNLKIETSRFGTLMVDLSALIVFQIHPAGNRSELPVTKMIQREFGLTLVLKTDTFKLRCKMSEKVAGMKNVGGIKSM